MKKFLGIGFVFGVKDNGVNKHLDETNNKLKDVNENIEEGAKIAPKKGSWLTAISEIAKMGLLKNIADGVSGFGDKLSDVQKAATGKGLSDEFKSVEAIIKRVGLQLGDVDKAAKLVDNTINDIVKSAGVTVDKAEDIAGAFVKNNLGLEENNDLLLEAAKITKAFGLSAEEVANSLSFGKKTLGFSNNELKGMLNRATMLEGKTGLSGLAGNLPNVLNLVQDQIKKGIISPSQAKAQVQRIQSLTTQFRNTGIEIGQAQGFVENLAGSSDNVAKAFSEMLAGKGGQSIADIAKNFGMLGLDIDNVVKSIKTGNIDSAFNQIKAAGAKAAEKGGDFARAYKMLISDAFGEESLGVMAAANTKAFGEVKGTIDSVDKALADGKGASEAQKVFDTLNDTIENQEMALKGLNQEFERGVSTAIQGSVKEYNRFKIETLKSLADATKGTDSYFMKGLVMFQEFQQGGILPFVDTLEKLPFVSRESIFKVNAAIDTLGPIIKDNISNVYFFSGALANIAKVSPSPLVFLKKFGGSLMSAGSSVIGFAKDMPKLISSIKNFGLAQKVASIATKIMAGAQAALNIVMNLNPIFLVVTALAALTAGVVYAYKNFQPFTDFVDQSWESIKEFGVALINLDFDGIVGGLKKAIKFFFEWMTPIGLLVKGVEKLGELFPDTIGKIIEWIKKFMTNGIVGKFTGVLGKIFGSDEKAVAPKTVTAQVAEQATTIAPKTVTAQVAEQAKGTSPISVAEPVMAQNIGQPGEEVAYAPRPAQAAAARQESSAQIADPNIKQLAFIFSSIGQDIVNAIMEGKQSIEIKLEGDAKKLFRASSNYQSNKLATQGVI